MTIIQHASTSEAFADRLRDAVSMTEGTTVFWAPEAFASGDVDSIIADLMVNSPELVVLGPDSDLDTSLLVAE